MPRRKSTELVDYKEAAKKRAKARQSIRPAYVESNTISIKGGVLSHQDVILDQPLPVIILDEIVEKSYYPDKFNENEIKSPDCYSFSEPISTCTDQFGSNMVPHSKSKDPQNEQCEGCWANEFGSDVNGGRGKACKDRRRLIIMKGDDIAVLKIPPTGLRVYDSYVRQLERVYETVPEYVVTNIELKKLKPQDMAAIPAFAYAGPAPNEAIEKIEELQRINRDILLQPFADMESLEEEEKKTTSPRKKPAAPRKKTATRRKT